MTKLEVSYTFHQSVWEKSEKKKRIILWKAKKKKEKQERKKVLEPCRITGTRDNTDKNKKCKDGIKAHIQMDNNNNNKRIKW